jgi:hypothetical protein
VPGLLDQKVEEDDIFDTSYCVNMMIIVIKAPDSNPNLASEFATLTKPNFILKGQCQGSQDEPTEQLFRPKQIFVNPYFRLKLGCVRVTLD